MEEQERQAINRLRSRAAAMEQLLEVYEQTVLEKSGSLERTLAELGLTNETLRREITERQRAEAALQRAHGELELRVQERTAELLRANQELEAFAHAASHDLQEPLRKIQSFGARLVEEYGQVLDDSGRDLLGRMTRAAERLIGLINDLLMLSKVNKASGTRERVALEQIVQEVLGDLEVSISEHRAEVVVEPPLPVVEADATQMRQLFQNLIGNALKFHRADRQPRIRIYAHQTEGSVATGELEPNGLCRITVEDNGIGFEQRYADRIFELFQRLHGHSAYPGTGIGLALCRKIVQRHGGAISARGTPGQGATFEVELPMRRVCEAAGGT